MKTSIKLNEFRAIMILTTACLILVGCGKSGGDQGGSAAGSGGGPAVTQNVYGTYMWKEVSISGVTTLIFATFSPGQYENRTYRVQISGFATFLRYSSTDIVVGNTHHTVLTHATCTTINGTTAPSSDIFPVTPIGNNQVDLFSNGANANFTLTQVNSIDEALNDLPVVTSHEVTDCSAQF